MLHHHRFRETTGVSFIFPDRRNIDNFTALHTNIKKDRIAADLTVFDILLCSGCKIDSNFELFHAIGAGDEIG